MAFCRYCGKELVNGQCDCAMSRRQQAGAQPNGGNVHVRKPEPQVQANNYGGSYQNDYERPYQEDNQRSYNQPYQKIQEPFFVPSFNLDFSSFSGFISSIRDQSGVLEENRGNNPYEQNVPIVPDCIEAEANEVVIKQYNLCKMRTRWKGMKAEGRLMITNRRLLFRAAGTSFTGNTLQEHQFNIDEIGGVHMQKDYKFSIFNFLLACFCAWLPIFLAISFYGNLDTNAGATTAIGLIMGIIGMAPTFVVYKHFALKYFFSLLAMDNLVIAAIASNNNPFIWVLTVIAAVIFAINTIIICFVPNFRMEIKTKGADGALVIRGTASIIVRLFYPFLAMCQGEKDYCGFDDVMPWEDTVMAINEVGTMIDDLQKNGDYAIEKWSR